MMVVSVPDFSNNGRHVFEARTLMFLASWYEYVDRKFDHLLHIACIGAPPESVKAMCRKMNIKISQHQELRCNDGRSSNKLRAFEVENNCGTIFLLDTDVLFLGDIDTLLKLQPISASPANVSRVPNEYWKEIYSRLHLNIPLERLLPTSLELKQQCFPQAISNSEIAFKTMFPYYNAGVLVAPCNSEFADIWANQIKLSTSLFDSSSDVWSAFNYSDQVGLALTVEIYKQKGVAFHRLPTEFHVHWRHIYYRTFPLSQTRLFHFFGIFNNCIRPLNNRALGMEINRYGYFLYKKLFKKWLEDYIHAGVLENAKRFFGIFLDITSIILKLHKLHKKHVWDYMANHN